eukprot:CAMPEP_0178932890 /NCGR_PEP_ID=MMETSP0786-20121207/22912_1 /TAXON_ID=186022 /ORGANISM="Thalassionema frauenfeldii, Strain CCMP 1798" /LENGTH=214 /DNA_ID=CAMNT_0020610319 /DNA_START=1302 /DNA_END=1946 /DNA_ORIENTATION=-
MWFATRFMRGLQRRHGQLVKQDWAPPIKVIHGVDAALELKWNSTTTKKNKKRVAEMGVWFIVGICSELRGEEFPLVKLAGTARSLKFLSELPRTKGNRNSGAWFKLPIASITRGTHLQPGKWIKRLIDIIHSEGRTQGRLLQQTLVPPQPCEFQDDFFTILEHIQATTNLISDTLVIREEAGILRSLRRALTDHALYSTVGNLKPLFLEFSLAL